MKYKNGNVFTVGLTGQSGAGKTLVSEYFASHGCKVIDADKVSRKVTEKGSDCNKALKRLFPDCISEELELDRRKLGALVFANDESLKLLNQTIFPYINAFIENEIADAERAGADIAILDAPTLFEAGADRLCDMIVSVMADYEVRLKRIALRDGLSEQRIKDRFSSQRSADFFIEHSDAVLENNSTANELTEKAKALLECIKERINGKTQS